MIDLFIAMGVMAALAIVVLVATAILLKRSNKTQPRLASLLLTLFVVLSLGLLFGTKDRLFWAGLFPVSAAIVYSNVTVLSLAAGAGAAFRLPNRPRWRQYLSAITMMFLSLGTLVQPVLQPWLRPTHGSNLWASGDVCIQTQPATCSSAAGATLLATYGIAVTEAQMVQWCLNDSRGTPSLGLWRALCIATKGTAFRPQIVNVSADELLTKGPWPSTLVVGLPPGGADSIYSEKYGWSPGFRHSVVLFGIRPDGTVDIGDPSIGRETWSQDDIRVLWRREAITLAK